MLEDDYSVQLSDLMSSVPNQIVLPEHMRDILQRSGPVPAVPDDRRRFARYYFRTTAILETEASDCLLSRGAQMHQVYTTNLSRSGISFVHFEQLFPGEQCHLWLEKGKMPCLVMHCSKQGDRCFRIGAALGTGIPEGQFKKLHGF